VIRPKDKQNFYASRSAVPVFRDVVTIMIKQGLLTSVNVK